MNLAPEELVLNVPDVKSLVWEGDDLIDWVMGGQRISLSGAIQPPGIYHSYRFDSAIASPSGRFTALFEKLGTKALLLDHGKLSRELNRSYYCADVYEYPISFLSLPDGTEAIAHITARPNWPLTNSYTRQPYETWRYSPAVGRDFRVVKHRRDKPDVRICEARVA